jgi:hypothetical protein
MATLLYPTALQLELIEQNMLPRLTADDPINEILPVQTRDEYNLMWEQLDNYQGLLQARGMNAPPPQVKPVGVKQYSQAPGVYGEFSALDEMALTIRRQYGTFGSQIDVGDLVRERQDQLIDRDLKRRSKMGWDTLLTGAYTAADLKGAVVHSIQYTPRTYNAPVGWGTFATAAPLADFRAVALMGRGTSAAFDAGAKAYANMSTVNNLLSNTNNADLFGRRTQGLGTLNTLGLVNQLLVGENLPALVPYDQGYIDDTGTFQLFIPNNKVVVVGRRTSGAPVGNIRMVRNANNDTFAPGVYIRVFDKPIDSGGPRTVEIHRGWTGGVVVYYVNSVVVMNV